MIRVHPVGFVTVARMPQRLDLPMVANNLRIMSNELGRRIRAARERKGWTQQQLALAVGVGARTVGGWERGETVPLNRMGKLDEVLGPGIDADPTPRVSRGTGMPPEVEVMFAHFDNLSQIELFRLSALISNIAIGKNGQVDQSST